MVRQGLVAILKIRRCNSNVGMFKYHVMNRKSVILTAFAFSVTMALIAVGIWSHMQPSRYHANWQLCRLDIAQPLNQSQVHAAKQFLKSNSEVSHVHYSANSNAIVVGLTSTGSKAAETPSVLIHKLKFELNIDVGLYETDPANLASGCPITGRKGIIPRFKNFFSSFFNQ